MPTRDPAVRAYVQSGPELNLTKRWNLGALAKCKMPSGRARWASNPLSINKFLDQPSDQGGPSCLVVCPQARTGVPIEILMEPYQFAPIRVLCEL